MEYRELLREELPRLKEVDRAETIEKVYYFKKGRLELVQEHWDVKGWNPEHLQSGIRSLYHTFDEGGFVYGAFDKGKLAGVVSMEITFIGERSRYLKVDKLYVSKEYRKLGVGRVLMEWVKDKARALKADKLYISATPSENTIGFYMNIGCRLTEELIPELFELEPEDIHLELLL